MTMHTLDRDPGHHQSSGAAREGDARAGHPPPSELDGDGIRGAPDAGQGRRPLGRSLGAATALAVVVVVVSSLWNLTRRPFWIDEAISLGATNQLGRTIGGTGGTMALYYALLDGWTALFGTGLAAMRSLSVVLTALAVVAVARVARGLLRPSEAVVAVLLVGAAPVLVRMAQDARAYALVLVLITLCWGCLSRAVEAEDADPGGAGSRTWFLALAPLAVAGVCSHGLFTLHLAAVLASVVVLPRRIALLRRLVPAALGGILATAALVSMGAAGVGDWIPPLDADQVRLFVRGLSTQITWLNLVLATLAALGIVALTLRARATTGLDRWRALAPLWWGLLAPVELVLLSLVRPTLLDRYVFAAVPGLAMLVAVGGATVVRAVAARSADPVARASSSSVRPRALALVVVAALLAGVLTGGLVAARLARTRIGFEDWDAAVRRVAEDARPGDAIVFPHAVDQTHPDTVRPPFEAAWSRLPAPPPVTPLDPARPLGQVRRFDEIRPAAELSRAMVDHPRVWAVFFPGFWPSLEAPLSLEPAASALQPVGHWTFDGGIEVMVFAQRP